MEAHLPQRLECAGLDGFWRQHSEGFGACFHSEKLKQIGGGCLDIQAHLVQGILHLPSDSLRAIHVDDPTVVAEEINDGMVGHGMPIGEAASFEIRYLSFCQALAKLIEQARLTASCFRHNANDLSLPVFHLLQRLNQRCEFTLPSDKLAQYPIPTTC